MVIDVITEYNHLGSFRIYRYNFKEHSGEIFALFSEKISFSNHSPSLNLLETVLLCRFRKIAKSVGQ